MGPPEMCLFVEDDEGEDEMFRSGILLQAEVPYAVWPHGEREEDELIIMVDNGVPKKLLPDGIWVPIEARPSVTHDLRTSCWDRLSKDDDIV
jgi:hypothetical protein